MKRYILPCLIGIGLILGCQKDFLDKKPKKSLLVPTSAADFQALLDNYVDVIGLTPSLQILSGDEIFQSQTTVNNSTNVLSNSYLWQKDLFMGANVSDWNNAYQQIFYANIVLEGLEKNKEIDFKDRNELSGQSLFVRAHALFHLSQLFADHYDAGKSDVLLGLPIPLSSDVNLRWGRSTQKQLYDQIIKDLLLAESFLGNPKVITRGGKAAVYGLLARVYLVMNNFQVSKKYAQACLKLNDKLLDYNTLNVISNRPFPIPFNTPNPEIIYFSIGANGYPFITATTTLIDRHIVDLYDNDDLRKRLFLRNLGNDTFIFKGSYTGASSYFTGIATDEIYLILAESQIRTDEIQEGIKTLNELLKYRFLTGKFIPVKAASKHSALELVLIERKKQLLLRGMRWSDLRRLNIETDFAKIIKRESLDKEYVLYPNDKRYVFPIPDRELVNNPMVQNER